MSLDFVLLDLQIDGNAEAPLGKHVYPFCIQIPTNLVPSFQAEGGGNVGVCALQYYLKAQYVPIDSSGWLDYKLAISKYSMLRRVFITPAPSPPSLIPGNRYEKSIPITKGFLGMGGEDMCKVAVEIPKLNAYAGE